MNAVLNERKVPYFEGIAATGKGVFEALREIGRAVILDLKRKT
jgi:orotidine-5'-phosphate decarboxylase